MHSDFPQLGSLHSLDVEYRFGHPKVTSRPGCGGDGADLHGRPACPTGTPERLGAVHHLSLAVERGPGRRVAGRRRPALRSSPTRANAQGLLQGAMTSVMTATAIVGPPLANGLFALSISPQAPVTLPGAPFFLGSILCLAALWLAARQFPQQKVSNYSRSAADVAAQATSL